MTQHIHLIAVCGTAMGTLAGMLKARGFRVTGSDENVYPPMSTQLEKWGILIQKGFKAENLNPRPDLVIVGNAVSKTNPEVEALLASGIRYLSLPQALGEFFLEGKKSLVVAGTHGKTTTTSLLAWTLFDQGLDPSFLVGGIPKNFDASFRLGEGKYFVIEGDEYDTAFFDKGPKFWHYRPFEAILTGIEFDHADIYRDLDHLMQSFRRFVELIPSDGKLYLCGDSPHALPLREIARCPVFTYGLHSSCEIRAEKIDFGDATVGFDLIQKGKSLGRFSSPLPGRHNLQNLLGVLGPCLNLGLSLDGLQKSVLRFESVKRRQEVRGIVSGITVIDDFAHHPTAVAETIDAIKQRYPGRKVWGVFEPRSNTSRRAVFQKDFAEALSHADEVVLAKVFMPEKVKNAAVLDEAALAQDIEKRGRPVYSGLEVDEIVEKIAERARSGDVLLIMSNGGFGNIHQKLLDRLGH
ncbi:MAG: UDP-N-acetylmuramate:L-alanyl-gamma-D-glutamyl-meso-diaminopimelate ligase [bacterium]